MTTHRLSPVTDRTITDPAELLAQLAEIRARGYAESNGERQVGASSVAAPVLDRNGNLLAVISVCGPEDRFQPEAARHAATLLDAIDQMAVALGHRRDG